jgi:hypothetical protein
MKDADIRPVLDARLQRRYGQHEDTVIIHEFGIHCGIHRVDMAVVNGVISGYEIKSQKDTLKRLPAQVRAYGMVFDKMSLVVSEKHHQAALEIIPDWWEVLLAEPGSRQPKLLKVRGGTVNRGVKPYAMATLIWRDQSLALLEDRGLAKGLRSASREKLWDALVHNLSLPELQAEARKAVRAQRDWLQAHHP